jgi:hypothetical protein
MVARVRGWPAAAVVVAAFAGIAIIGWRLRDVERAPQEGTGSSAWMSGSGGSGGSAGSRGSAGLSGTGASAGGSTPGSASGSSGGSAAAPTRAINPAEPLIASAHVAAADGNFTRARDLLDRAYALDPRPTTLLEIARLDHRIGRCRDARRAAGRVLEAAPAGPLAAEARDLLGQIGHCD